MKIRLDFILRQGVLYLNSRNSASERFTEEKYDMLLFYSNITRLKMKTTGYVRRSN